MRTAVGIIGALLVAACTQNATPLSEEQTISRAKTLLRHHLHNPSSVRFLRVRIAEQQGMGRPAVCGEVDARNAAGKYTGFRPFYVWGGDVGIEPRSNGIEKNAYPGGMNGWRASHLRFCRLAGGAMSPPPPSPAA